ncbi:MAG: hypothetical protein R6V26_06605 [Roseovarius sp.]
MPHARGGVNRQNGGHGTGGVRTDLPMPQAIGRIMRTYFAIRLLHVHIRYAGV